ncbi:MAG: ABC transporter ATP-binding protein [Chloroflexota bacterium]
MIRVTQLRKTYPGQAAPAVAGVSFTVDEGRFYTLLGPSGCGKTTTLRCIAGLEQPDSGTIELGDTVVVSDRVNVPTYRRDLGMVFQSYAVWPHMDVFENVAFPLRVGRRRMRGEVVRQKVTTALELVGLSGLERRMATELSGGQQQRLSVARAIVREPKVLLLDEPLSNLDAKLRERMRGELTLIQRRLGLTTLFVTHDQIEALSMSDQVAVMKDGIIVQQGTPRDIYHSPASEFVASFIGSTNLVPGEVEGPGENGTVRVSTPCGTLDCETSYDWAPGRAVMIAVRPEEIEVHRRSGSSHGALEAPNVIAGKVQIGLFTGTFVDYHVEVDGMTLQARSGSRRPMEEGEDIQLVLPPNACRLFPRDFGPDRAETSATAMSELGTENGGAG